jgi:hypothetical protein
MFLPASFGSPASRDARLFGHCAVRIGRWPRKGNGPPPSFDLLPAHFGCERIVLSWLQARRAPGGTTWQSLVDGGPSATIRPSSDAGRDWARTDGGPRLLRGLDIGFYLAAPLITAGYTLVLVVLIGRDGFCGWLCAFVERRHHAAETGSISQTHRESDESTLTYINYITMVAWFSAHLRERVAAASLFYRNLNVRVA